MGVRMYFIVEFYHDSRLNGLALLKLIIRRNDRLLITDDARQHTTPP